ncbi:MAG: TIGR02281 family clan AA aspartic protease [Rhodospirillaceae bacterium]|jgi:aspartyl protease family protein|nr:TIGR02281 family clan AA aspartic protease [Rhodospirillaceae bacterium]
MKTSGRWIVFLVLAVGVTALVVYLAVRYPDVLNSRDGQIDLTQSLLWLGLIGASLFLHRRMPLGHALRYATIWVALGAGLVLAYSFRHDAQNLADRMVAELLPHQGRVVGDSVEIRAGDHGHFVVEALVENVNLRFLVDTGASDVVLSPSDARRLGFKSEDLTFSKLYNTANGTVRGAPVRLGRISIGAITIENVRASVNGAEMARSLLGMSFLNRLSGYEVRKDRLVLRP